MDGAHQFQSSVDRTMPIRLLHYAACFYSELLKQKTLMPGQSLPPVFPVVVYNGSRRWTAPQDVYEMVQPEPPAFLQVYQPHLRYYLIDEGRYTEAQLEQRHSPLSGVFGVENAGASWEALQQAVDRMVAIIQEDPHKERIDRVVTRWLKRHLHRLGAAVNLDQLDSLVEDKAMLAENLENLVRKERQEDRQEEARRILSKQVRLKALSLAVWRSGLRSAWMRRHRINWKNGQPQSWWPIAWKACWVSSHLDRLRH